MNKIIASRIALITKRLGKVGKIDYSKEAAGVIVVKYPDFFVKFTTSFWIDQVQFKNALVDYTAEFSVEVADKDIIEFALDVILG